jgi:hypothetical protein
MGASWLEVDTLIRQLDAVAEFPHADALPAVMRARQMVAQTAMVVSRAGLSDERQAETEAHDLLARARVAVLDATVAVQRAKETVELSRATRAQAHALIAEARALRARDRSRSTLSVGVAPAATPAKVALARVSEPASAS